MKTNYLLGLALAGLGLMSGCIIYSGSGEKHSSPPPVTVVHRDTTAMEIDAVCRLGSDADRHDLLIQIAGRPNLSPVAQTHLVKMVRERLSSDHARMDVLMMLANNPCLSEEGVRAIVEATHSLGSDANRRAVLEAIGRRQVRPPMPGPIPVPCGPIPVPEISPHPQPGPH